MAEKKVLCVHFPDLVGGVAQPFEDQAFDPVALELGVQAFACEGGLGVPDEDQLVGAKGL